jgi:hypothetical protein
VKFGTRPLKGVLPYVALGGTMALALLAFRAQKKLWRVDMQVKQALESEAE